MIELVAGQNTVIPTNNSYRLELDIANWSWGAIVTKAGANHSFLQNEAGISAVEQQLLLNIYDIATDIEKITVYIWQNHRESSHNLSAAFNDLVGSARHASIDISGQMSGQTALNVLEIYRYKESWKIRCVLQGYSAGLTKLLEAFHLKVEQSVVSTAKAEAVQPTMQSNVTARPMNGANHDPCEASVLLSWQSPDSGKKSISNYFMGDKFKPISDLRIGCFYELNNSQIGIVYSFEDEFKGSFEGVPYISASRSSNQHLERLDINTRFKHKLNRYLIFVTMMEAYDSWDGLNVEVQFNIPGMDNTVITPNTLMMKPIYAVAMIDFSNENPKVTPVNEYFNDLPELNQAFGWGLPFHRDQPTDERGNHRDNEED